MASNYMLRDRSTHAEMGAVQPDHWMNIAHLPYFCYGTRSEIEEKLRNSFRKYILRNCNDPSEFINGQPNPNLFVISYRDKSQLLPGEIIFCHVKFLRVPDRGVALTNRVKEDTRFFPTVKEMLANSSIYYIHPLMGENIQS